MIEATTKATTAPSHYLVTEQTYPAPIDKLWKLWTTKEGFESWWPPAGFRTKVHDIEAHLNGKLRYDMIAESPELVAALAEMGLPASHIEHARFCEFQPQRRLVLAIMLDFLPGVTPYENQIMVDFIPAADSVRMTVSLGPMHTEEFRKICADTLASQLTSFEKQLQKSN